MEESGCTGCVNEGIDAMRFPCVVCRRMGYDYYVPENGPDGVATMIDRKLAVERLTRLIGGAEPRTAAALRYAVWVMESLAMTERYVLGKYAQALRTAEDGGGADAAGLDMLEHVMQAHLFAVRVSDPSERRLKERHGGGEAWE